MSVMAAGHKTSIGHCVITFFKVFVIFVIISVRVILQLEDMAKGCLKNDYSQFIPNSAKLFFCTLKRE